jgi:hypothetical protein
MKILSVRFVKSILELKEEISPVKNKDSKPQVFFLGRSNV